MIQLIHFCIVEQNLLFLFDARQQERKHQTRYTPLRQQGTGIKTEYIIAMIPLTSKPFNITDAKFQMLMCVQSHMPQSS